MNKFTVIIPARMHSTRLPHKMTLDVGGVPLIIRTALQAQKSHAHRVVVATDHTDILAICQEHKIDAILTATTHHSGTDRVKEAVESLGLDQDEIVINVQGDEPLIDPQLINQLAQFLADKHTDIATLAHPIHAEDEIFNPHIVKVVLDHKKNAMYFSRAPIPFYRDGFPPHHEFKLPTQLNILRHIGIYAYRVDFLHKYNQLSPSEIELVEGLEQLRALYNGYQISVLEIAHAPAAGVDTLTDLQRVRQLVTHIIT